LGSCSGAVSWTAAEAFCSDAGARLCTVAELQADEAKGTGCSSNKKLIWTSEACSAGYYVAPGSTVRSDAPSCNTAGSSSIHARCCADVFTSPSLRPVPAPTNAPIGVSLSVSTCDELGWANADSHGSAVVCGETNDGLGGCSGAVSQSVASGICKAAGARLCTVIELEADEPRGTGCKYDTEMTWTSDECTAGYYVAPGSTKLAGASSCESSSTGEAHVRCCADV